MKEERDNLEIIKDFVNKQEITKDVLSDAKALATEKYENKEKKTDFRTSYVIALQAIVVPVICFLLLVAIIVIAVVVSSRKEYNPRFFDEAALSYNDVPSVAEFCENNMLAVHYFDLEFIDSNSRAYYIEETDEFVILYQFFVCVGIIAVDEVTLSICVTDYEFERFYSYMDIIDTIDYNGITVHKNIEQVNERYTTLAMFDIDENHYYLKIISFFDDPLTYYLDLLIS